MTGKIKLLLLVLCHIYWIVIEVDGGKQIKDFAASIIQTIHGDKYKCVDFYKQPAFDHPMLKNHDFNYDKIMPKTNDKTFSKIWLNGKGCPSGTVPIKKITKEDLIRSKLVANIYATKIYKPQDVSTWSPGVHRAVLRTKDNSSAKYFGSGMNATQWNPIVDKDQYSSGEMILQNDGESIIVGWTVNPMLFNDNQTRLFIYTNMGNSHCFNTQCPGFVQIRSDLPLGMVFTPSKRGGPGYGFAYAVEKDQKDGNWYFKSVYGSTIIGFWPNNIFKKLSIFATHIEWGGETYSPPKKPSPPMGAGESQLIKNSYYCAVCLNIQVIDEYYNEVNPKETETFSDNSQCYTYDAGIVKKYGRVIFYGCPAGNN